MDDPFEKAVSLFIRREGLLRTGQRVVAAVSGGADSVALLLVLRELSEAWGLGLSAFHFNHQLRPAAEEDEAFVRDLCRRLRVELQVERSAVRDEAERQKANLEGWARRVRYRALLGAARRLGASAATGHTLDDQAETVLLKLVRGAGPEGLGGIAPLRRIGPLSRQGETAVVRPLLGTSRSQVLAYLERRQEGFRQDESNFDLSLDRNWVRAELIPLLEGRLNPRLTRTLGRTARLWAEVREWLEQQAEETLQEGLCWIGGDLLVPLYPLLDQPLIVQRTALKMAAAKIRRAAERQRPGKMPLAARKALRFVHIEALLRLARQKEGSEARLPGGLRVMRDSAGLRFSLLGPVAEFCYRIDPPDRIEIAEVGKTLELIPCLDPPGGSSLCIDPDASLKVRNRRPGDRFRLAPNRPRKKLKKLMAERRIPRGLRDRLIVLESGGRPVWVEGFGPHPDHRPPSPQELEPEAARRRCFEIRLKLRNS